MERDLVTREGVKFAGIRAGAMHGVGPVRMARGFVRMLSGVARAWVILGEFRPDVVFLTGGFVGVPVSIAAWLRRAPVVVYLPDIEPGLALKVMARLAQKVATTTEASAQFIRRDKMVVTGYPVREGFYAATREKARAHFGIGLDEKALLVVGGSTGARSINRAVIANLHGLLGDEGLRLIHVAGRRDWDEVRTARDNLPSQWRERYMAFEYLHEEMADAMAAADLAISRSGASSLGELPFLGLPAILAPYPYAWRYQKVNAQYLVDRGAAVIVEDARLSDAMLSEVKQLLDDPQRLAAMRRALLAMGGRDGARDIAQLLFRIGTGVQQMA
ncbi:MAG: UDP-N-acetylglucosamine--N-acetylmuramyl-(pentapeptide) pyrophosphoryl-undecaprenol N-acetylglucosamine transferase [Chloroflexi bacterium]|nr:UDP-N-acetylglucosamine--N-acetylmuramyl-(pentapeptide) pyrophosphoryl-undecaprenol N-acetylglucosamine transferase [Chloroflexota bacterium]MCL5274232.1 UDP-N-acetylglucosamine--N-acetylmuramyl-(pentapeptide) pyrophosphoryl-undecaprenol N-acetylglucosamine transferase [Chloroflexota bacterium]